MIKLSQKQFDQLYRSNQVKYLDSKDQLGYDHLAHVLNLTEMHLVSLNLVKLDLSDVIVKGCKIVEALFKNCELGGSFLEENSFQNCTFIDCKFFKASLMYSTVENCHFQECDFSRASLNDSKLIRSNFQGSNFQGAELAEVDLSHSKFHDCNFGHAWFYKAKMEGVHLSNVITTDAKIVETQMPDIV